MENRHLEIVLKNPLLKKIIPTVFFAWYKLHLLFDPKLESRIAIFNKESKFPKLVHPENLNICNSRCVMCPYIQMTRKKGKMSMHLFKKIVDECVKNNVTELKLFMYGEPLLDKTIPQKIKYAKDKGIPIIYISTNASVLDEKMSRQLIDSGLDYINISFDGVTKKTYESIRVGLDFNVVEKNIRKLIDLKRKLRKKKPFVTLQIIQMKETKSEVKQFLDKWRNFADGVKVEKYHDYAGQKVIDSNKAQINQWGLKRLPCEWLWNKCTILWNGDIVFCCLDYDSKIIVGNTKQSIFKAWNSKKMKNIRKLHLNGDFNKILMCANCTYFDEINTRTRMRGYINYLLRRDNHF